jgi:hypothetical protein
MHVGALGGAASAKRTVWPANPRVEPLILVSLPSWFLPTVRAAANADLPGAISGLIRWKSRSN